MRGMKGMDMNFKDRFGVLGPWKLAGLVGLAWWLTGCSLTTGQSNEINTVLNQVANTATADLQQQQKVALAATPPDTDGANCAVGALTVAAAIQKVLAATPQGTQIGAFTTAEIASLYQPGSAQFNWAVTTLETACIAKVHDVNQAVNSTAGILTSLPSILTLAPAVGL